MLQPETRACRERTQYRGDVWGFHHKATPLLLYYPGVVKLYKFANFCGDLEEHRRRRRYIPPLYGRMKKVSCLNNYTA
ncbi:hypothetical protein Daudx_1219 [Candidatus Desulforudis audaxviator]|nr:hypothetical protein Daudx_1219 [Candidatus Desulforudis audaxviator]